jgi:peroxiredoxin
MKCRISVILLLFLALGCEKKDEKTAELSASGRNGFATSTIVSVGDMAPDFTFTTLDEKNISLSELRGKVVFINFFAIWCGPCMMEMPLLQSELSDKINRQDFCMIAIGREHKAEELIEFKSSKGYSFPMAADPDRSIYRLFATAYIPRNFVVGKDGIIKWASVGFDSSEFQNMVRIINVELERAE